MSWKLPSKGCKGRSWSPCPQCRAHLPPQLVPQEHRAFSLARTGRNPRCRSRRCGCRSRCSRGSSPGTGSWCSRCRTRRCSCCGLRSAWRECTPWPFLVWFPRLHILVGEWRLSMDASCPFHRVLLAWAQAGRWPAGAQDAPEFTAAWIRPSAPISQSGKDAGGSPGVRFLTAVGGLGRRHGPVGRTLLFYLYHRWPGPAGVTCFRWGGSWAIRSPAARERSVS